jgi:hypothetical protein
MRWNEIAERSAVAVMFGVAGGLSRDTISAVETLAQILAFLFLAAAYEFVARPIVGKRPRIAGFAINAVLAAVEIVAIRWQLEGLCPGSYRPGCIPFS